MKRRERHLSQPLYESLPWIYMLCGLVALAASYRLREKNFTGIIGVLGLAAMIGGIVVLLRRRDFRELRSRYGKADSSLEDE